MVAISKKLVTRLFDRAGITINGQQPWDIRVHHQRFYDRVLTRGSLGFGESYMDGDWDTKQLDNLMRRIIRAGLASSRLVAVNRFFHDLKSRWLNLQSRQGSMAVAEEHYDLDHRLYEQFLGPFNQYTCCFFNQADSLPEAELEKLEMIGNKLDLQPGDRVLDIGCGWGGFARYAAEKRGCHVTGISISQEQIAYARKFNEGLSVDIVESDYRDLPVRYPNNHFDKVVIIGMIEHVGYKNYRRLMKVVHRVLKDDGLFLLHTIGNTQETTIADPWIEKYIFRNSMLPSMGQLAKSIEQLFTVHDWENYGQYYAPTLAAWNENFQRNWKKIKSIPARRAFDERFRRMFTYYFLSCKAAFETEHILLWHLVMTKKGSGREVYPRVNLMS